jgi:outer membrane protein assembly factor BamB
LEFLIFEKRISSRSLAFIGLTLFLFVWWITSRQFSVRQRFLGFACFGGGVILLKLLSHPSAGMLTATKVGVSILATLSTLWLWISRHRSVFEEVTGVYVLIDMVFGLLLLLRWDGLDGDRNIVLKWRWTPTAEEQFQQEHASQVTISREGKSVPLKETPNDWTAFRGGEKKGNVEGVQFDDWSQTPPKELWRRRIGMGWSSVISVGNHLFTQEQQGDQEAVICYQAETGEEVWVHLPAGIHERFEDARCGPGPRSTAAFQNHRIYAVGAKGLLECLDGTTGDAYWSKSICTIATSLPPEHGVATSPLIADGNVVVFAGGGH